MPVTEVKNWSERRPNNRWSVDTQNFQKPSKEESTLWNWLRPSFSLFLYLFFDHFFYSSLDIKVFYASPIKLGWRAMFFQKLKKIYILDHLLLAWFPIWNNHQLNVVIKVFLNVKKLLSSHLKSIFLRNIYE